MKLSLNIIALFAGITLFTTACEKKPVPATPTDTTGTTETHNEVHFNFENYFGDKEIELDNATYTTGQSEDIKISVFNYWITNIKLKKNDGTYFTEDESYRLMRADKHATLHFHIEDVPVGTYTGIEFMIGVDVPRNTSGAQTGALDPAVNGDMFWSWSTGYIQAKLEGTSPQSTEPNNFVQYHIGGVKAGSETPRAVSLTFANAMEVGQKAGAIKIKTDAAKWFGPGNPIKIADNPTSTHGSSPVSLMIADNYAKMFSMISAGNEE